MQSLLAFILFWTVVIFTLKNTYTVIMILKLIVFAIFLYIFFKYILPFLTKTIIDIYCHFYFKSDKFNIIKSRISKYVDDCNELNKHIEDLKFIDISIGQRDYGQATLIDDSYYNYERPYLNSSKSKNICECSLNICKKAEEKPFVYFMKYFDCNKDEETLEKFEDMLNKFLAVEEGKELLLLEINDILDSIKSEIPYIVKKYRPKRLIAELNFQEINFSESYYLEYGFRYCSAGGNSSMYVPIIFNLDMTERFIKFLSKEIESIKSAKGQRALMTKALREYIKQRDDYTCQYCGLSIADEPNLLLEIDHITPISMGGLSIEENLQTLCWRCNRSKGSKML